MSAGPVPPIEYGEEAGDVAALAVSMNERLESAAQESVNHAFNVGCSFSLLPVAILVGVVFLLSRGSWVVAFVALVVGLLLALGFAALVSTTARTKSVERTYQIYVAPSIERYLTTEQLTREEFDRQAALALSSEAPLRKFLSPPPESEEAQAGI
jgi:hypothetical protein